MIDSTDQSIISNDTTVRMIYKIVPVKTISQRIDFSFSNALYRPLRYEYQLYEQEVVQSSLFSYIKNGVTYSNALITDDGIGNLRICYNVSGVRVVIESNIGSVNYDTGEMSFDINPFDYVGSIDFYGKPNLSDVTVSASKFLRIDYSKTVVIVTPVS